MATYTTAASAIALTAATAQTLIQLCANTRTVQLEEWSVSFDGTTSGDIPCLVQVVAQGAVGTGASPTAELRLSYASAANATVKQDLSSEPSVTATYESYYVTPNGGLLVMQYPEDGPIIVPASEQVALLVTSPDGGVNASAWMAWSEL